MGYHIGIDARYWRKETGGLSRYSQQLVFELAALDRDTRYTVIITPEDEPEFLLDSPNVSKLVVPCPYYSVAEQRILPGILRRQRFDLVHFTHFAHPILYRQPFVITVHDLIMHLFPSGQQTGSLLRRSAYRAVMRDARRARRILVPSESTRRDLVSMLGFSGDAVIVTPEGSSAGFRVHTHEETSVVRARLNLPEHFLLFVSRWERYKGLDALLEAFEGIRSIYPEVGLVITGKPSRQRPELGVLIKEKQAKGARIITPGFVDDADLAVLYSAASVYVHPSWYEGFGIMILEAFSSGVPVVTSSVSSLPEVVGDAGLLVNPYSVDDIRNAILSILSDPLLSTRLAAAGLERVKRYSWKKMAQQTHAAYLDTLRELGR